MKKKLGLKGNTHLTLKEVETKLNKARTQYKVCKRNDKVLRRDFLESLAAARAAEGNIKASTALQEILHREQVRSMYRQIKQVTKKGRTGTTKIQLEEDGITKDIT